MYSDYGLQKCLVLEEMGIAFTSRHLSLCGYTSIQTYIDARPSLFWEATPAFLPHSPSTVFVDSQLNLLTYSLQAFPYLYFMKP